jgi:glycosyltransferase involved in cell wall biosynthesis
MSRFRRTRPKGYRVSNKNIKKPISVSMEKGFSIIKGNANKKKILKTINKYTIFTSVPNIGANALNDMVTIIITNYNKNKLLARAVRSALGQSYKNIEIIVIDDKSSDNIENILKPIINNRVRIILNKKNYGPYACRNYALDVAKGKYVTFLDADDVIHKDHILALISCYKAKNLSSVLSLHNRYATSGRKASGPKICEASIFFDRKKILNDIGYYHMVRCGADTEFRRRMEKYYGSNNIGVFCHATYRALYIKNSLTRSSDLGSGSIARSEYANSFRKYHKKSKNLFFDYRTMRMPFGLNGKIMVKGFNKKSFIEVK